jgi:hypothetical protein
MPTMLTRWWTVLSSRTSPLRWQHAASYTMYESVTASAFICHRLNCNATVRSPAFKVTGGTEVIAASRRRQRSFRPTGKRGGGDAYLARGRGGGERADGAGPVVDGEAGQADGSDGVHGGDGAVAEVVGALREERPQQDERRRPQHHPGRHPARQGAAANHPRLLHGRRRRHNKTSNPSMVRGRKRREI